MSFLIFQIEDMLSAVDTFLKQHTGEIVLLDFNHFYSMADDDHRTLLSRVLQVFGTRLCAVDYPVAAMNLDQMISHGKQVQYGTKEEGPKIYYALMRSFDLSNFELHVFSFNYFSLMQQIESVEIKPIYLSRCTIQKYFLLFVLCLSAHSSAHAVYIFTHIL